MHRTLRRDGSRVQRRMPPSNKRPFGPDVYELQTAGLYWDDEYGIPSRPRPKPRPSQHISLSAVKNISVKGVGGTNTQDV